jgi:PAS domain S-box-containing protein
VFQIRPGEIQVRQIAPATEINVDSIKQRRDLLGARGELDNARRKLARTERALESLTSILSLIPDPIEVVSADYTILFANRSSRLLHEIEQLEGTFYYESVMGLDGPPDECPIRRAVEDDREAAYTAACDNGDVFEVAVTPIVLSDGRRAAMCYSKPVVYGGVADGPADRPAVDFDANVLVLPDEIPDVDDLILDDVPEVSLMDTDRAEGEDGAGNEILEKIARLTASTLDAVLDQMTDGALMMDTSGNPIVANKAFAEIAGFDPSNPPGADELSRVLFPGRAPETAPAEALAELAAEGRIARSETTIVRLDGERAPVELAVSRLPAETGTEMVLLVTVKDLREKARMKGQLADALSGTLAGERITGLVHQVHNDMTPAFEHVEILAGRDDLDDRTRRSVTAIQHYLNQCHEYIETVFSISQPSDPETNPDTTSSSKTSDESPTGRR